MIEGEDFHQSFVDIFRKYRKEGKKEENEAWERARVTSV